MIDVYRKKAFSTRAYPTRRASCNNATLRDLGGAVLSTFREASRLLDSSHADTSRLDGVRSMNAGWTKVYALMLDGFPIYGGRVGAAMGYLVQQYCTRAGLRQVPTLLCFRWVYRARVIDDILGDVRVAVKHEVDENTWESAE